MELKFIRFLGSGAFGDVWQAEDVVLKRSCAVKFFRKRAGDEQQLVIDARSLTRVHHETVVDVYTVEEFENPTTHERELAIVMEYVEGTPLYRLKVRFGAQHAQRIVGDLVDAVEAFHSAGVVHSDLHDRNVIVTNGGAKVIDPCYTWSLAGRIERDFNKTKTDDVHDLAELVFQVLQLVPELPQDRVRTALDRALKVETITKLREAFYDFLPRAVTPAAFVVDATVPAVQVVENAIFRGERVDLDGKLFRGCTFERCILLFSGEHGTYTVECTFIDCQVRFKQFAGTTINFLNMLYKAGGGFRVMVETLFQSIRDGTWLEMAARNGMKPVQGLGNVPLERPERPCACGSGQAFKDCHGDPASAI